MSIMYMCCRKVMKCDKKLCVFLIDKAVQVKTSRPCNPGAVEQVRQIQQPLTPRLHATNMHIFSKDSCLRKLHCPNVKESCSDLRTSRFEHGSHMFLEWCSGTQTRAKTWSDVLGSKMASEAMHLKVSSLLKFSWRSMHASRPPSVCLQIHSDTSTGELTNTILFLLSLQ